MHVGVDMVRLWRLRWLAGKAIPLNELNAEELLAVLAQVQSGEQPLYLLSAIMYGMLTQNSYFLAAPPCLASRAASLASFFFTLVS